MKEPGTIDAVIHPINCSNIFTTNCLHLGFKSFLSKIVSFRKFCELSRKISSHDLFFFSHLTNLCTIPRSKDGTLGLKRPRERVPGTGFHYITSLYNLPPVDTLLGKQRTRCVLKSQCGQRVRAAVPIGVPRPMAAMWIVSA